ncbi:MAG: NADPH-dependent FMN reductase [Actinomycetaceae bacterium]
MTRIAIIAGSTRPHRAGSQVAEWALATARRVVPEGVEVEPLDLATFELPVLDEPAPAMSGAVTHDHTRRWAAAVASFDGFVVVTPEYNHGVPGPLKNAIDYLFFEWNDKAVGFVSYGVNAGVRAVEQLRQIAGELKLADVRTQVALSMHTDFDYSGLDITDPTVVGSFTPAPRHVEDLTELLGEVTRWSRALSAVRLQAVPV